MPDEIYEVTVWNLTNGDIERKLWRATQDDLEALIKQYEDEPFYEVQWEEA